MPWRGWWQYNTTHSWSQEQESWVMIHTHLEYITTWTSNNWFQTVTGDKQTAATEHCEGKAALRGWPVLENDPRVALRGGRGSLSSTLDVTGSVSNWWTRWQRRATLISLAFKQASLTQLRGCFLFLQFHFNQTVHHTYVRSTRGNKQRTAGAKPRQPSCSALPTDQSVLGQ